MSERRPQDPDSPKLKEGSPKELTSMQETTEQRREYDTDIRHVELEIEGDLEVLGNLNMDIRSIQLPGHLQAIQQCRTPEAPDCPTEESPNVLTPRQNTREQGREYDTYIRHTEFENEGDLEVTGPANIGTMESPDHVNKAVEQSSSGSLKMETRGSHIKGNSKFGSLNLGKKNEESTVPLSPVVSITDKARRKGGETIASDLSIPYELKQPGSVLIINNTFIVPESDANAKMYKEEHQRWGSHKDVIDLENLFRNKLKCTVTPQQNVTSIDLPNKLEEFKKKCEDSSFAVVIFMSHGSAYDQLQMHDHKNVDLFKDLVYPFNHANFPSFIGKPKIFLLQACAADENKEDTPTATDAPVEVSDKGAGTSESGQDGGCSSALSSLANPFSDAEMADTLIMKPCLPHGKSYRNPLLGSRYIQAIVTSISKNWKTEDLEQMHERAAFEVVEIGNNAERNKKPTDKDNKRQTPWFGNIHFRKFYFPQL